MASAPIGRKPKKKSSVLESNTKTPQTVFEHDGQVYTVRVWTSNLKLHWQCSHMTGESTSWHSFSDGRRLAVGSHVKKAVLVRKGKRAHLGCRNIKTARWAGRARVLGEIVGRQEHFVWEFPELPHPGAALRDTTVDEVVAWFQVLDREFATHPSGRTWAIGQDREMPLLRLKAMGGQEKMVRQRVATILHLHRFPKKPFPFSLSASEQSSPTPALQEEVGLIGAAPCTVPFRTMRCVQFSQVGRPRHRPPK